ncbi:MAG: hypothetical protein ACREM1_01655 [Longimicrobiales bacterium]
MAVGVVHSFGVLHVRAGDGWLIAPETPSNYREWEGRHHWQCAAWGGLDMRLRHRHELRVRIGAQERHRRLDMYVRATLRFGVSRVQSPARPAAASGTASHPK